MLNPESKYYPEQEFAKFEEIMNKIEILTQEEYDFCFAYDKDIRKETTSIGNGRYLNLNVYTEYDHEKREYEY